jgi:hypothetical protein
MFATLIAFLTGAVLLCAMGAILRFGFAVACDYSRTCQQSGRDSQ